MTTVFFGARWDAPLLDDAVAIRTPVGRACLDCGELVANGDRGLMRAVLRASGAAILPVHAECELLGVIGHQFGVCSCSGFGHDRDAARELWRRIGERRGRPLEDLPAGP